MIFEIKKMKVILFGKLKEITNEKEIEIKGIDNLTKLKKFIFKNYPDLKKEIFIIAVNQKVVNKDIKLKDKDEIAFLPPISGG